MLYRRLKELKSEKSVEQILQIPIGRCHRLKGKRKNQYAIDLIHPFRMISVRDLNNSENIIIISIENYH